MSGRFDVDAAALKVYADTMSRYAGQTKAFGEQVSQADVGDASWGIVGLFAKDKYTETIENLQEFLRSAEGFANGLDERMRRAGTAYDEMDGVTVQQMAALTKRVGSSSAPGGVSVTPSGGGYGGQSYGGYDQGYGGGEFANFGADNYAREQEQQANDGSRDQAVGSLVADGASFVYDCYGQMQSMAANPLSWLVNMGLGFLLQVVQPLQDLLEMVSGDPDALEQASSQFLQIEQGLENMKQAFTEETRQQLTQWTGVSAQTAKKRLTEFGVGAGDAAVRSGSLAELLAVSAIIMEVIYDLLKSILSEVITFLIELWLPALAAAVTSFGASVAAAAATTGIKVGTTVATTTQKVTKLSDLLQKLVKVFIKLAVKGVQKYFQWKAGADRMREQGQAARDGQGATGPVRDHRGYEPGSSGYQPGGQVGGSRPGYEPYSPPRHPGGVDVDRPDFDSPRPGYAGVGAGGGPTIRDHRRGFSPSDFDSDTSAASFGAGGGGAGAGAGAGGFGPSGAGSVAGAAAAGLDTGAQSGAVQSGAGAAGGAAAAAGAKGGAAGGGMMGGAGAGGGGKGQGGGDSDRKGKNLLQGDAQGLFGSDEEIAPPVIGDEK